MRRENNEFRVIPDIIISDDESDDKSCVNNCEMKVQKEEKVFRLAEKTKKDCNQRKAGNLQHRFNIAPANIRKKRVLLL